ncbi:MAG TPA: MaoC/PaaZ C-terminal domain-containing protein [Micromonosporaceae bacterium]
MDTEASRTATPRRLASPPSLTPLLVKAILTAALRRGDQLPATELVLEGVVAEPTELSDYARVCGFRLTSDLPPTYPHILGFPLAMRLMTDPGFPFPLPGLVHASNLIVRHRPIPADAVLSVRVRADSLEPTDRGRQFAVRTEAYHSERLCWEEASWYLRLERRGSADGSNRPDERDSASSLQAADAPGVPTAIWRIPGDAGKRYAAVSGDYNPIHRYTLGARLAGFRKPIAHGMWTMARCLASLEGRLPDAFRSEFRFRRPITLGTTVGFGARWDDAAWRIGVTNPKTGKVYMTGRVESL